MQEAGAMPQPEGYLVLKLVQLNKLVHYVKFNFRVLGHGKNGASLFATISHKQPHCLVPDRNLSFLFI